MKTPSIAIIGAGVAGLACAHRLSPLNFSLRQFDKGRSPGGRLATRRIETPLGEARFDHGAQYIVARDPAFSQRIDQTASAGAATPWTFDDTGSPGSPALSSPRRWVGTPGMSALARSMAHGLTIETGTRVTGVHADGSGWRLVVERSGPQHSESLGPFDAVIVALPAEQAAPLLAPVAPDAAAEAAAARTAPCWAGLLAFDRGFATSFEVRRSEAGAPLSWVARENSKPGRSGPEAWVVHASPAWSRANLEETPEVAAQALWRLFRAVAPAAPDPIWLQAHRWRFASVEATASSPFFWDPALRIGVCGDWRLGPRVEAAWLSGDGLGSQIQTAFD